MLFARKALFMRVRSWLRMNAGGVPNTCKSNEMRIGKLRPEDALSSGGRVSNTWVTCPSEGDNIRKRMLKPHRFYSRMTEEGKEA